MQSSSSEGGSVASEFAIPPVLLPPDLLRTIFRQLASPLLPAAAGALASTCHTVREAVRSHAAGDDRSEVERLRLWWGRATALCVANRMTRERLRVAKFFDPFAGVYGGFGQFDILILGHLMASGSFTTLKQLCLTGPGVGDDGLRPFCDALADGALPRLKGLFLGYNNLGDGFHATALAASPTLRELDLGHNKLSSQFLVALAGVLSAGALKRLEYLNLQYNNIDGAGVEALAESGKLGRLRALKEVRLHGNGGITAASLDLLAAVMRDDAFPALRHLALPKQQGSTHRPCPFTQHAGLARVCEARRGPRFMSLNFW